MDRTSADQRIMDGFRKHQATLSSLFMNGAPMSAADIVATLQGRVAAANNTLAARAAWQGALETETRTRASTDAFVSALRQALRVAFPGVEGLADFGLAPKKAHFVSPEKRVAAAAKAKATRTARRTMGARQREKVVGDVMGVTVTPVVATPPNGSTSPPPTPSV